MKTIEDIKSAFGFMTIIPMGKNVKWSPLGMIRFFPLVGLVLGGLLFCFDRLVCVMFPEPVVALMDGILLVFLTGAFHIDGLGDAADGLFSHRPKERVMEIMKDSRIGMMGLVTVTCVFALKIAGIYCAKVTNSVFAFWVICLIVPAYARAGMLFGIRYLKYGRKETGTGLDLFEKPLKIGNFFMMVPLVLISVLLGFKALVFNLVFVICTAVILIFYKIKLNCITGDMLGAMTEIMEAILFLAAGAAIL